MNVTRNGTKGRYSYSDFHLGIDRDPRKTFDGVAVERIQQRNDVPIYLVLATFDLAACLLAAFLKRHSILVLLWGLYRNRRNRTTWDLEKQGLKRPHESPQDGWISHSY